MLIDAYRELNHRKLFWVTLGISGLVVAAFAMLGNNAEGLTILHWTIDTPLLSTQIISTADFYKLVFSLLGVQYWLGWFATILAIISTASIFPDFVGSGSIDLLLSKPIGRMRLFFTKFLTGLLFVTLQVTIFTFAAILVIGIRGGEWVPWLLISVPLMVLFYSYLFCVQAVVGMVTRSAIASIIAVLLFWMLCFGLQAADEITLAGRVVNEIQVERTERRLERQVKMLDLAESDEVAERQDRVMKIGTELEEDKASLGTWTTVNWWVHLGNTLLPKTGETSGLLLRVLQDKANLSDLRDDEPEQMMFGISVSPQEMEKRMGEAMDDDHSWVWIIGTSLLFEAVILGLGGWWFVRRDF
jgi:hypothetical protein